MDGVKAMNKSGDTWFQHVAPRMGFRQNRSLTISRGGTIEQQKIESIKCNCDPMNSVKPAQTIIYPGSRTALFLSNNSPPLLSSCDATASVPDDGTFSFRK